MAAVPTVADFATGNLPSTDLNAKVRDPLRFLIAPPMAHVRATSAQSIPNGTSTAVNFDTDDLDSVNGHDTVTNTSRYTAVYQGWYQLSGGVSFAANVTNRRSCSWFKNGSAINGCEATIGAGSNIVTVASRVIVVFLTVGDYVELFAFQDSGGALNTAVTSTQQPTMTVQWRSN